LALLNDYFHIDENLLQDLDSTFVSNLEVVTIIANAYLDLGKILSSFPFAFLISPPYLLLTLPTFHSRRINF
jgi:hypothetical protein